MTDIIPIKNTSQSENGFSQRLKHLRKKNGWNQRELAWKLESKRKELEEGEKKGGFTDDIISQWELLNPASVKLSHLPIFVEVFGLKDTIWLLGLTNTENEGKWLDWEKSLLHLSNLPDEDITYIRLGCYAFENLVTGKKEWRYILGEDGFRSKGITSDPDLLFCLQSAFDAGALRFIAVEQNKPYEKIIFDRYKSKGLKKVLVAKIPEGLSGYVITSEIVAFLAAQKVFPSYRSMHAVGLGAGYTLLRFCTYTTPLNYSRTKWLPLMAFKEDQNMITSYNYSSNYLAHILTNKHRGTICETLNFKPNKECGVTESLSAIFLSVNGSSAKRNPDLENDKHFKNSDAYHEISYLNNIYKICITKNQKPIGEILGYLVNSEGKILAEEETRKYLHAPSPYHLKELRKEQSDVWLIASRKYKAPMVKLALEKEWVSGLVIDQEIATELIPSSQV